MRPKAPSDIGDAFQTLADYMKELADAGISLKPGQTPDPQTLAKLQKPATEIDQAKLSKAGTDIAHWVSHTAPGSAPPAQAPVKKAAASAAP